jgi:transcriptional regulator with XRE-family HTH domain
MNSKSSASGDIVFGNRIKDFRDRKGWKQNVLASKANLSQSEISKIESGTTRFVKKLFIF